MLKDNLSFKTWQYVRETVKILNIINSLNKFNVYLLKNNLLFNKINKMWSVFEGMENTTEGEDGVGCMLLRQFYSVTYQMQMGHCSS